ncbi:DUF5107 domain-containing protein [Microbacterium aquimaris]|uniref:DUF5107 domain-containing protein n=1 Tax=Microbacterium aquimaris TaxID=459816 RepID=A0ABU5N427_9MICO|nr:DUF5107 domain-containing protein [Microbacterium aquimaris]MDZ8160831.1 DUF5107 domain-containing protein [Microbacterium aquimaris]
MATIGSEAIQGCDARADSPGITLPHAPSELAASLAEGAAIAWSEPLAITTYEPDAPSRYPMFLDHRVYQGSSGKVYPLPFTEGVSDEGVLREWDAVHVENRYVRLVVLPELGGRIHIGYDKRTGYDFFYRNNVIKPALVGLAGPWISGGVEFNWPQHHRPATYLPVETSIETGADGTVTVWCHDHDPFARMSAQHGVRLRPESSVVELVVRLHNRTNERHTFLWWANVAARVHDDYQAFFPEDVRYVADHARRALTAFPEADRPYYGVDYPALASERPGADRIDWYKNIPVPTSYMIVDSQQDFFGGYDHAAGGGFVHWAERRISPGKKLWTWGDAPFGHAWDDQLTDGDGPYVELMAGVYTDNQPDFTWILPGETKVFSQYWYPIPAIGVAHQATPDAALHVGRAEGRTSVRAAVTSPRDGVVLSVLEGGVATASRTADLEPGAVIELDAEFDPLEARVELRDGDGRLLVAWEPVDGEPGEPWVASEPPAPEEIETVEELYLTGLHLSQYRHPTRSPLPYWEAALARDPGDVRTNLAMADRDYRAFRYEQALVRVELAIDRLTRRNANPIDAEAFYLRGLVLMRLGRRLEAEQAWGKAGWDGTWAAPAGFALAQSLLFRGVNRAALRVLDSLAGVVGHDTRRTALQAIALERLGRKDEAASTIADALERDPLDATLRVLSGVREPTGAGVLLDVAIALRDAGETRRALALLDEVARGPQTPAGNLRPIAQYLRATILDAAGEIDAAREAREMARREDALWAFPSGADAHDALSAAIDADAQDSRALHLRGMLLYAHGRRRDGAADWRRAIVLGDHDPVLLRNAAVAAYNVGDDDARAWELYEMAVAVAPDDARLRYEQDQLAIRLDQSAQERFQRLEPVEPLVLTRDDFTIAYVRLLVAQGMADRAYEILTSRSFHPWEGGEGEALAAWDLTLHALGRPLVDPPPTLGEARPQYMPPLARRDDGATDYFATSLPELLLFAREASLYDA